MGDTFVRLWAYLLAIHVPLYFKKHDHVLVSGNCVCPLHSCDVVWVQATIIRRTTKEHHGLSIPTHFSSLKSQMEAHKANVLFI